MRKKILAFSFFPAFLPPKNGGVERLYRLYSHLAERFDIKLVASSRVGDERSVVQHSATFHEIRVPKDAHFEDCYVELQRHAGEGDLSAPALAIATRKFGALHDEYLLHYAETDIIIHDSPFLIECDLFRGFDSKLRVYNSYNFETGLYESFHSKRSSLVQDIVRNVERETCQAADLITSCSPEDANSFRDEFDPSAEFSLVPNGFTPTSVAHAPPRYPERLIFIGSAHQPNIDAVELIRNKLAPQLPDFEFHLVGSCSEKGTSGNVISHGTVDQETKHELLYSAGAAINPMASGSGSSLKVADIADHGVPLISTAMGARGFDLEPGQHYLPLDLSTLAKDVKAALHDRQRLEAVATAAKEHFREQFTWRNISSSFAERLEELQPRKSESRPYLVVNDYDSFDSTGGGATRTRGLCRGLSERSPAILIAFGDGDQVRRTEAEGRVLVLTVPKTAEHLAAHDRDNEIHWVSSADVVNYEYASSNDQLKELFRCAAGISSSVICEHPYMVGLPRHFGTSFVYSSQNFELALKREGFQDHPRREALLSLVEEAEQFACGASEFIVAVSQNDARNLSGTYRFTAPILVIPNGAEGPAVPRPNQERKKDLQGRRMTAVFMGSPHMPNVEAAQWIATKLAPAVPDVDFVIIGGVSDSISATSGGNLTLTGQVSAEEKSRLLYSADVAINPMSSGSGSNVKLADFLQHGLPVISTKFGARGYEDVPEADVIVVDLESFEATLKSVLRENVRGSSDKEGRRARYAKSLSMDEGGRALARLIDEHSGKRRKALYVTYRYNEPALGGGEAYVVKMIHALARSGWQVDVVSPAAERITNVDRFRAAFDGDEFQPVPVGHPRVRSGKFRLDDSTADGLAVQPFWEAQPDYEAHLAQSLKAPIEALPAFGWADYDGGGRWSMTRAGIFLPVAGELLLAGRSIARLWLQFFSEQGDLLHDCELDGRFTIERDFPAGFVELRSVLTGESETADNRPLALYVQSLRFNAQDILQRNASDIWARENRAVDLFAAHARACDATRGEAELELSNLRRGSTDLTNYVSENVGSYDLLITHNAVFGACTSAVAAANDAGVPSVLLPHVHLDDDFYHFPDIRRACADATKTLVCPQAALEFFEQEGLKNLHFHAPGIDADNQFLPGDREAFREVLGRGEEFFLVLGRKAGAKGYKDVIAAAESLPGGPIIVLVGPDDDGEAIESERAIYLGLQPSDVVRGALMECLGLINMSRSESFGMVLLEAGLASKPVIANRACAAFHDIVEDGKNGFLASAEDLAPRMRLLAADAALRSHLGQEGRRRAVNHDWAHVEDDFVSLCNGLVAA